MQASAWGRRRVAFGAVAVAGGLAFLITPQFSAEQLVRPVPVAKPAEKPTAKPADKPADGVLAVTATPVTPIPPIPPIPRFADFGSEKASADARHIADWVVDSRDNARMDFIIVDKKYARIYAFDAEGRLRGASPVLLGAARGDESVPGIGTRPMAQVRPAERTTPAGRFVAERGRNAEGEDVVWVDYDAAVSIHRVRPGNGKERRLERLVTPTISDNRISYGCINVPVAFYESRIRPVFATRRALVYVLPEIKDAQQVFGSYDVELPNTRISP